MKRIKHTSLLLFPKDCGDPSYTATYLLANPAHADLADIAAELIAKLGGHSLFSDQIRLLLRRAYDEVIDMPRTGRWSVAQLEKTEKTYVGTKVEILIRNLFDLPKGQKLDLQISGSEVDVKNTTGGDNWEIPSEAIGEICLLVSGDEIEEIFSIGLFRALQAYLRSGTNKDGKRSIQSPQGKSHILWLVKDAPLPTNFMLKMRHEDRRRILGQTSGAARIRELFRVAVNVPIHRDVVEGLAQQKDPMKRVRSNGGARDALLSEGILVLSGKYDSAWLNKLGYDGITHDYFVSLELNTVADNKGYRVAEEIQEYMRKN
jgi:hypothetical protein